MNPKFKFPKKFFWGASTAGHQVEGGNYNQWTVWELAHASQSAQEAHKRYSFLPGWDGIKKQAEDPANYVSGEGVDHYNRFREDFDLLQKLNLNSFRFGIEWSRIEPEEGQWSETEIDHYKDYIKELKSRGIEPFLNIWHFTLPVWFENMGGFTKYSNLKYWERFVQKVADELLDGVNYVITINEPNVYATFSYLIGEWPPQEKRPIKFAMLYWNLTSAHRRAYRILKAAKPKLQVGIASQLANVQAKRPHNLGDEVVTKVMRYLWNWWFLRRTSKQQDFIGINYYYTDYYKTFSRKSPKVPLNDMGAYMEPEGLYPLLIRAWSRYKKPVIITENGVADSSDQYRRWWLEETMVAMERALSEGVDIKGYIHWSLLDNFEWSFGWWPKFGLVEVDREHGMKRTIRPSAEWWATELKKLQQG